jgi:hypothetical protein
MPAPAFNVPTGHVFRRRGQRADTWYAKYSAGFWKDTPID